LNFLCMEKLTLMNDFHNVFLFFEIYTFEHATSKMVLPDASQPFFSM
jgi:hypothetical protein